MVRSLSIGRITVDKPATDSGEAEFLGQVPISRITGHLKWNFTLPNRFPLSRSFGRFAGKVYRGDVNSPEFDDLEVEIWEIVIGHF
jgi:hypothetical protein